MFLGFILLAIDLEAGVDVMEGSVEGQLSYMVLKLRSRLALPWSSDCNIVGRSNPAFFPSIFLWISYEMPAMMSSCLGWLR